MKSLVTLSYIYLIVLFSNFAPISSFAIDETYIHCENKRISRLYNTIQRYADKKIITKLSTNDIYTNDLQITRINFQYKEKVYVAKIEIDHTNLITHIGLDLFNDNEGELDIQLIKFIEQFWLYFLFENHDILINNLLTENINIYLNNLSFGSVLTRKKLPIISTVLDCNHFTLKKEKGNYFAHWKDNNNIVCMKFPSRQCLIWGVEKTELDSLLIKNLLLFIDGNQFINIKKNMIQINDKHLTHHMDSVYKMAGEIYLNEICSDRYYIKNNNINKLLFNENFPKESITNLFLEPECLNHQIQIDLEIKSCNEKLSISLQNLISFFKQQHNVYIGFEHINYAKAKLVVVFENNIYNHIHLLTTHFPLLYLKHNEKYILQAQLFTTIPNDNVKEIFGTTKIKCNGSNKNKINITIQ